MKKPYQIESQRAVKQLEAMATDGNSTSTLLGPGEVGKQSHPLATITVDLPEGACDQLWQSFRLLHSDERPAGRTE